jgi:hypothetical protein
MPNAKENIRMRAVSPPNRLFEPWVHFNAVPVVPNALLDELRKGRKRITKACHEFLSKLSVLANNHGC